MLRSGPNNSNKNNANKPARKGFYIPDSPGSSTISGNSTPKITELNTNIIQFFLQKQDQQQSLYYDNNNNFNNGGSNINNDSLLTNSNPNPNLTTTSNFNININHNNSSNISTNFFTITKYILQSYFKVSNNDLPPLRLVDLIVDQIYPDSLTLRKLNENASMRPYHYYNTVSRDENISRCPIFSLAVYFLIRWSHPNPPITTENYMNIPLLDVSFLSLNQNVDYKGPVPLKTPTSSEKISRANNFDPPKELIYLLFPWLPTLKQEIQLLERSNYRLYSLYELFEFIAKSLIQDLKYLTKNPSLLPNIVTFVAKFVPDLFQHELFVNDKSTSKNISNEPILNNSTRYNSGPNNNNIDTPNVNYSNNQNLNNNGNTNYLWSNYNNNIMNSNESSNNTDNNRNNNFNSMYNNITSSVNNEQFNKFNGMYSSVSSNGQSLINPMPFSSNGISSQNSSVNFTSNVSKINSVGTEDISTDKYKEALPRMLDSHYMSISKRLTTENVRLSQQVTQLRSDLNSVNSMCRQLLELQKKLLTNVNNFNNNNNHINNNYNNNIGIQPTNNANNININDSIDNSNLDQLLGGNSNAYNNNNNNANPKNNDNQQAMYSQNYPAATDASNSTGFNSKNGNNNIIILDKNSINMETLSQLFSYMNQNSSKTSNTNNQLGQEYQQFQQPNVQASQQLPFQLSQQQLQSVLSTQYSNQQQMQHQLQAQTQQNASQNQFISSGNRSQSVNNPPETMIQQHQESNIQEQPMLQRGRSYPMQASTQFKEIQSMHQENFTNTQQTSSTNNISTISANEDKQTLQQPSIPPQQARATHIVNDEIVLSPIMNSVELHKSSSNSNQLPSQHLLQHQDTQGTKQNLGQQSYAYSTADTRVISQDQQQNLISTPHHSSQVSSIHSTPSQPGIQTTITQPTDSQPARRPYRIPTTIPSTGNGILLLSPINEDDRNLGPPSPKRIRLDDKQTTSQTALNALLKKSNDNMMPTNKNVIPLNNNERNSITVDNQPGNMLGNQTSNVSNASHENDDDLAFPGMSPSQTVFFDNHGLTPQIDSVISAVSGNFNRDTNTINNQANNAENIGNLQNLIQNIPSNQINSADNMMNDFDQEPISKTDPTNTGVVSNQFNGTSTNQLSSTQEHSSDELNNPQINSLERIDTNNTEASVANNEIDSTLLPANSNLNTKGNQDITIETNAEINDTNATSAKENKGNSSPSNAAITVPNNSESSKSNSVTSNSNSMTSSSNISETPNTVITPNTQDDSSNEQTGSNTSVAADTNETTSNKKLNTKDKPVTIVTPITTSSIYSESSEKFGTAAEYSAAPVESSSNSNITLISNYRSLPILPSGMDTWSGYQNTKLDSGTDNSKIKYKLSRDNKTVWDLYTEWYIGLNGNLPIVELIKSYGFRKWKVSQDSHFFPTRRIIIDYIESECDRDINLGRFRDLSKPREDFRKILVGDLEKFRINNSLTLNSLSMYFRNLSKANKEICIFENSTSWPVRKIGDAEKAQYCKRQPTSQNSHDSTD
ncbi:hypothetical protein TBLA_0B04590 [Henningerozyma blattae CBS 6284]|uniref:Transcription activator GCR1-like domain-containing protein n=1 Tax=Henningerozyma blattae (strain ATCC 34711 / CBS 6284 / DSM 70876 / NBRC 10599 / NRRL Y-10934 / UCD 77-7) TaxID=1071380 RepID=I2GYU3_HENB6|nr:hypothetical protein TBLA_0B04590 [Tetrapisispora blattae CBS 6284]CCH59295.1 hypothetical protein TBLA_0B04590 [Tetrapisispora blattae CBS 6284]